MFERHYMPDSRFVYVRVFGSLDDVQLREHVERYNEECAGRQALLELADGRGVEDVGRLTVQGVIQVAGMEEGQPRALGGRLALVVSEPLHFGLARAYASIAGNVREETGVYYEIDEALRWMGPEADTDEVRRFVAEHGGR